MVFSFNSDTSPNQFPTELDMNVEKALNSILYYDFSLNSKKWGRERGLNRTNFGKVQFFVVCNVNITYVVLFCFVFLRRKK